VSPRDPQSEIHDIDMGTPAMGTPVPVGGWYCGVLRDAVGVVVYRTEPRLLSAGDTLAGGPFRWVGSSYSGDMPDPSAHQPPEGTAP
jgi:hypothetical protein